MHKQTYRNPQTRQPLPTAQEWAAACDLKRCGRGWNGPCPLCGGTDRFHVQDRGNGALVGCRGCIDGQSPNERRQRFGEMLREVFPGRLEDRARPPAYQPRRMPLNQRTAPGPAPTTNYPA